MNYLRFLTGAVALVFIVGVAVQGGRAQDDQTYGNEEGEEERMTNMLSPSGEMIQPDWKGKPLTEVVEELSILSNTNISIDESVDPELKVTFTSPVSVYWRDVLKKVLEKHNLISKRTGPRQLEVIRPKRVDMEIRNSQFTSIVDTLSKLAGVSVIVSPAVASQNVTIPQLTLNDIPWQSALDTVVKTAGFATVEEDFGVIRVITSEELQDQLETRTFQLRYLRPPGENKGKIKSTYLEQEQSNENITEGPYEWGLLNLISAFLTKTGGEPIGSLQYESRRNILVVKDTPQVLRKIENMLNVLDNEPPQVLIQVRFVSTSNTFLRDLGLQLNAAGTSSLTGAQVGTELASSSANPPNNQESTDFPFSFGSDAGPNSIGPFLTSYSLDWTLRLFQRDTQSRVLQAPRLVVKDGQKATVFVGQEIHYGTIQTQTATAGSTTTTQSVEEAEFSPVESGFQLYVVPHVVRGTDRIMLSVVPKNNNVTFPSQNTITLEGGGNQVSTAVRFPTIQTSTVVTKMILQSGTTAVLAGLINRDENAVKESVPFLGDVPVMEYLFGSTGQEKTDNYDFFFITAYILPSVEEEQERLTDLMENREEQMGASFDSEKREGQKTLKKQLRQREESLEKEFHNIKESGEN